MKSVAVRADFFDASALTRVFVNEPKSDVVRSYFNSRPTKYTTPFCFYEAMNVLKGKWKFRNQISRHKYFEASFRLTAWYGVAAKHIQDIDFTDITVFVQAKNIALTHNIDLSDAFRILSVKLGYFSSFIRESSALFITADRQLAEAAESEGLRVRNILNQPPPD